MKSKIEQREKMLEKAGYRFVGKLKHSSVRVCGWTKKSILGDGACYKERFYGINCHRCLQMTPVTHFCTHRCVFCWRDTSITFPKFFGAIDRPEDIVDGALEAQRALLVGLKGNKKANKAKAVESLEPKHVAISLSGEPMLFPDINGLLKEFHSRGMTTFIVTNGTQPKAVEQLDPLPTQIYLTIPAPDFDTYRKICNPVKREHWKDILKTIEVLKKLNTRKVARLTLVRDFNFSNADGYGELIAKGDFDYVEPKAYMNVGYSQERLTQGHMPLAEEIKSFAIELANRTNYLFKDFSARSRVALLCRDEQAYANRFINFGG